jgi:hypothetical protein
MPFFLWQQSQNLQDICRLFKEVASFKLFFYVFDLIASKQVKGLLRFTLQAIVGRKDLALGLALR